MGRKDLQVLSDLAPKYAFYLVKDDFDYAPVTNLAGSEDSAKASTSVFWNGWVGPDGQQHNPQTDSWSHSIRMMYPVPAKYRDAIIDGLIPVARGAESNLGDGIDSMYCEVALLDADHYSRGSVVRLNLSAPPNTPEDASASDNSAIAAFSPDGYTMFCTGTEPMLGSNEITNPNQSDYTSFPNQVVPGVPSGIGDRTLHPGLHVNTFEDWGGITSRVIMGAGSGRNPNFDPAITNTVKVDTYTTSVRFTPRGPLNAKRVALTFTVSQVTAASIGQSVPSGSEAQWANVATLTTTDGGTAAASHIATVGVGDCSSSPVQPAPGTTSSDTEGYSRFIKMAVGAGALATVLTQAPRELHAEWQGRVENGGDGEGEDHRLDWVSVSDLILMTIADSEIASIKLYGGGDDCKVSDMGWTASRVPGSGTAAAEARWSERIRRAATSLIGDDLTSALTVATLNTAGFNVYFRLHISNGSNTGDGAPRYTQAAINSITLYWLACNFALEEVTFDRQTEEAGFTWFEDEDRPDWEGSDGDFAVRTPGGTLYANVGDPTSNPLVEGATTSLNPAPGCCAMASGAFGNGVIATPDATDMPVEFTGAMRPPAVTEAAEGTTNHHSEAVVIEPDEGADDSSVLLYKLTNPTNGLWFKNSGGAWSQRVHDGDYITPAEAARGLKVSGQSAGNATIDVQATEGNASGGVNASDPVTITVAITAHDYDDTGTNGDLRINRLGRMNRLGR